MKKALAEALDVRGYNTLTPVQEAVTAPELAGRDMLVSAQTGSGKTLGFGLAIAPTLLGDAEAFETAAAPLALVIAPTRELAMQVKRELSWLYAPAGGKMASTVGGMDTRDERRALARGAHVVVATPGRLRDHIMRGSIDLSAVRAVVLDEADEMLDLGFREDLEFILDETPKNRQTLLFSATVPRAIADMAKNYQKDAERIATANPKQQHADIEYRAFQVAGRDGENAIINVLRYFEAPNAIVFCNTRAMVNRLTTRLSNRGFSVVALSGELTQSERTHALQAMRDGRARVCVATDVAARGIDLPNLELVVHAELPTGSETLLHRSGRTGRAGRKGVSAMIVPPASMKKAHRLLGWAKLKAEWGTAPSADDVLARDEERLLTAEDWALEPDPSAEGIVGSLVNEFSAQQLAAAYIRLYRKNFTAPEELSDVKADDGPRKPFGSSVWFSLSGGRATGDDPRRLLPMICKAGDVSREEIGAIRIQAKETFFEIKETALAGFLAACGAEMMIERATLTQLDAPPKLESQKKGKPGGKFNKREGGFRKREERGERPRDQKRDDYADRKPRKPKSDSKPIDWNDDPAPRKKKPKPGAKPAQGNSKFSKPKSEPVDPELVSPKKPRKKGAKPPAGKPSSKKNRARAAAAKSAGDAPPKRKSSKPVRKRKPTS